MVKGPHAISPTLRACTRVIKMDARTARPTPDITACVVLEPLGELAVFAALVSTEGMLDLPQGNKVQGAQLLGKTQRAIGPMI